MHCILRVFWPSGFVRAVVLGNGFTPLRDRQKKNGLFYTRDVDDSRKKKKKKQRQCRRSQNRSFRRTINIIFGPLRQPTRQTIYEGVCMYNNGVRTV